MLDWTPFNNTLQTWLVAAAVGVATLLVLALAKRFLLRQLGRISARTTTLWDDLAFQVVKVTRRWLLGALAIWAGSNFLLLPDPARDALEVVVIVAILAQIGLWGTAAIRSYTGIYSEKNLDEDASSVMTVRAVGFIASLVLWCVVFLVFLDNLGIDVTALIAGLGIGGIAVALAAQNILGDLFASLSIVLDKPFVVGDMIIVDDLIGTVERVGLKTTRLRSLSGEQLVFSNADLLGSRIRNYKRMFERRIVFGFGVEYGTPPETLEWIPTAVKSMIDELPDTRFDRAHFKTYGDSSLDFEVVYYVLVPDYGVYMDRQQAINLELYRVFEERGVSFAFPTRTLHIISEGDAQAAAAAPAS